MRRQIDIRLTVPQEDFVFSLAKFPAFVGGFGAGKSEALVTRLLLLKLRYPGNDVGYFAPTYDLIRLIAWPRFAEKLEQWGIPYKLNKSENTLAVHGAGRVIFRTLDNPDRIVGFEIGDAGIDEFDTLAEKQADNAWNKVLARCRRKKPDGRPNTCCVATTPEGFRATYRKWVRDAKDEYALYRAPTLSNPYLPADYVEGLRQTYPPNLLTAYVEGQFVNLTNGSVYPSFDRKLNHTDVEMAVGEPLHIGMDFNVLRMAAVVYVIRDGRPLAVDELVDVRDTPDMARLIRDRWKDKGHTVTIYPDASGQNTSSKKASESDISILRQAGFSIHVTGANPAVKDRVLATNAMLLNANGERRMLVNTHRCPKFTEGLEQQAYDKNGEPDKSSGVDHVNDAGTYPIARLFPVIRRIVTQQPLRM